MPEKIVGACHAWGFLYLWTGTTFLKFEEQTGTTDGRTTLGAGGIQTLIPFDDRIAVAGAAAVLATEKRYILTDLYRGGEPKRLNGGSPITQAGNAHWWVGWYTDNSAPVLRYAHIEQSWDLLDPVEIDSLPESEPARGTRIAITGNLACWTGKDGSLWRLNCSSGTVEKLIESGEGMAAVWMQNDGPRAVREGRGDLSACLKYSEGGTWSVEAPTGSGPLLSIHAYESEVYLVGDKIGGVDAQSGETLCPPASRPQGRWITAALVPAEQGGTRLLILTRDNDLARLTSLDVISGIEMLVWSAPDIEPLALLPVKNGLYIVHESGVTRLRRNSA